MVESTQLEISYAGNHSLDFQNDNLRIDPYSLFLHAMKSPVTKKKYCRRLEMFFDFIKIPGENFEERCLTFINNGKDNVNWVFTNILKFVLFYKQRIDKKEISGATLINYLKAIKLFCEMSDISINWKKITRGVSRGKRYASDRIPTLEEIRKIVGYPDRRIKPIVYTMCSSGIRLGAWDYLKWKHIIPIYNKDNNNIKAAKIIVYAGEEEEYFSFITPEAYFSLKEWLDFRQSYDEKITPDSWLMRNTWKKVNVKQGSRAGLAKKPIKFQSAGIRVLMGRAWHIQNIRGILEEGEKRHEFKSTHGFRKFFKSNCEQVMKSLHVEMLMGHNTGLAKNYYRPTEQELLEDYLKAISVLSINKDNNNVIIEKEIKELKEKNENNEYIIQSKIQERDDAIMNLSDQVMKLMNEINELKNQRFTNLNIQ
jgi:integrase